MQGGSAHSEGGIGTGNEQHRVWGGISNMNRWYEQQRVGKQREVAQLSVRGNAGLEQDRVGGAALRPRATRVAVLGASVQISVR